MSIVDKLSAEHYMWGDRCDGWHLVKAPQLSVIEERMPPGTSEVRHYHQHSNQFFYVLRGTLLVEVNGNRVTLNAGQGIQVGAGEPHQVRNLSGAEAEFLVISSPPSHGDRVNLG